MFHMATVTRTYMVDDLDGSTEDVENVQFSLDGHNFEIDLSAGNAARLREKLERFVEAGHQVKEQKQKRGIRKQIITTGAVSIEHTQAIRHWAKENGYQVSERGYPQQRSRRIRGSSLIPRHVGLAMRHDQLCGCALRLAGRSR